MEEAVSHERDWCFCLGTEDFTIEVDSEVATSELPHAIQLNFEQKLLEAHWEQSFAQNCCYLQRSIPRRIHPKTSYSELVTKLLSKLKESFECSWSNPSAQVHLNSGELTVHVCDDRLSLSEVLKFCPGRLKDERLVLLILFQTIASVYRLHQSGLPHLGITLANVFVDQDHLCVLGVPNFTALQRSKVDEKVAQTNGSLLHTPDKIYESKEVARMTQKWVLQQCSNYEYLMYLNHLAGRTKGDPVNSAILPWVTDFTAPHAGLRDLTKSKYHLTKGEAQLDANYQAFLSEQSKLTDNQHNCTPMPLMATNAVRDEDHLNELINPYAGTGHIASSRGALDAESGTKRCYAIARSNSPTATSETIRRSSDAFQPHHLLDMMPNLAYYTYMARRTPKELLTRYVRPIYQPNEFPPSMARLYQLTPEECIPEFFTDPSVFTSIHSDMADLGLPEWCATPEQFVTYHTAVLESDAVSSMLHHWIDLTFGYKLIGDAAVEAKNVHLELAGTQHTLRRSGITCLFRTPHPRRWVPSVCSGRYFGPCFPDLVSHHTDRSGENGGTNDPSVDVTSACRTTKRISSDGDQLKEQAFLPDCAVLHLPADYDPLALIRTYDSLSRFLAAETRHPDGFELPPAPPQPPAVTRLSDLLVSDVEAIACLAVELFTHSVVNYIEVDRWNHTERLSHASRVFRLHRDRVPQCLHRGLDYILNSTNRTSSAELVNSLPLFRPSARHLLHLLFEFPIYFYDLHGVILWLSQLAADRPTPSYPRPRPLWGPLSEAIMGASCPSATKPRLTEPVHIHEQAIALLYPHMRMAAARHPSWLLQTIQCDALWTFFYSIGGTQLVERYLLPLLIPLYRGDNVERALASNTGVQHPLSQLCSRRFLRLVMVYVSLDTFLTLIVPRIIRVLLTPSTNLPQADRVGPSKQTTYTYGRSQPTCLPCEEEEQVVIPSESGSAVVAAQQQLDCESVPVSIEEQPSLSKLVDEIGLDLRSADTEEEILDLIIRQSSDTRSPSMGSNCTSARSRDSNAIQFSLDTGSDGSPSMLRHSAQAVQAHSPDSSNEVLNRTLSDPKYSPNNSPISLEHTDPNPDTSTHPHNTIPPVAASTDSVIWMAKRVGPLITAQTLVRYLLTGLTICYEGSSQLAVLISSPHGKSESDPVLRSYLPMTVQATNRPLFGDRSAAACLRCLEQLVCVYGVSFVQHVYMPFVNRAICQALTATTHSTEISDSTTPVMDALAADPWNFRVLARVVAAVTFLQQFIAYLPDSYLCDLLQDSTLQDLLIKAIRLAGRHDVSFPAGASGRRALLYKIIDCIYVIGLRIGFELTRARLTSLVQLFFAMFDRVPLVEAHPDSDCTTGKAQSINHTLESTNSLEKASYGFMEPSDSTHQSGVEKNSEQPSHRISTAIKAAILNELRHTFDGDMARLAYVPFCRLAGGVYIDTCIYNVDWIHNLIGHRPNSPQNLSLSCSLPTSKSAFAPRVPLNGGNTSDNQSMLNFNQSASNVVTFDGSAREKLNLIACSTLYNHGLFHLRGSWSDVFQCEMSDFAGSRSPHYQFHGIRVAAFSGHTARINTIDVFPTEGSFLTTSHDKTVQLWSLSDSYNSTYFGSEPTTTLKTVGTNLTSTSSGHGFSLLYSATGRHAPTVLGSGPGSHASLARLIYREHRKPVFAAVYLPAYRLVASADGQLILWDPCTGQKVHSGLANPHLTALARCSIPGGAVLCADQNSFVYLVDPRISAASQQRAVKLASGSSLAPVVFSRDRCRPVAGMGQPHGVAGSSSNGTRSPQARRHVDKIGNRTDAFPEQSLGETLCSQMRNLSLALEPRLSGSWSSAASSTTVPGSAGCLRQLAQDTLSPLVFCAFTSGFATILDLRNGQVLHAWRAHSDCISQVSSWKQSWFVSTGDRSLAFWYPAKLAGPLIPVVRTLDHCNPHVASLDPSPVGVPTAESGARTLPGLMAVTHCANYRDDLIVCGPGCASVETTTQSSSTSNVTGSTSNGDLIGVYRPTVTGTPKYSSLGRIPSSVLRSRMTALASLPESGLILAGNTHGQLSLIY